jgi:signal transduction histidine kinase
MSKIPRDLSMRWRVRSQLLVPPLLMLLGISVLSVWMAWSSANRARARIETRVRDVARNLSEESSYPLAENVLLQMKRLSGADFLLVPTEGPPVSTLGAVPDELPPADTVVTDWQKLRLGPPVRVGQRTYLCGGVRLVRPPRHGETLYILYPETLWRDALWEAVWPVLLLGGSVGLGAVVLAVALGQGLSGRLLELERRTRQIAAGDFSPMPLPGRNDELRDLARSINEMAARLAQFQETVRRTERLRLLGQVSAGLTHQLRNGLTGARLALQVYLRENQGGADVAALEVALRQLTLLETNLKRFLDLGRAEPQRRERCDLSALVAEAVELVRPQCRHAGIELTWQPPTEAPHLIGDAGQLGQVVLNLLGNAVEAAGPGGRVAATVKSNAAGRTVLEVLDSGPGPPRELHDRLFEPFVTGKPEGVGLGLAVARQVVEAHGGRIGWERRDGRTCFHVAFPPAATEGTG